MILRDDRRAGLIAPLRRLAFRALRVVGLGIVLGFLSVAMILALIQRKMIYFPQRYDPAVIARLDGTLTRIPYTTGDGTQVAFYYRPGVPAAEADAAPLPERFITCFGGNAMTALDWLDPAEECTSTTAFLLVDYPGYGISEGAPSSDGIKASVRAAVPALAMHLGVTTETIAQRLGVVGFSLGCSAGLEMAAAHGARDLFLMAPFTDLKDMARLVVGPVLAMLLREEFDNRTALAAVLASPQPPRIVIYHGTADSIVPFAQGKELAGLHPGAVTFHPVEGADHNDLIIRLKRDIIAFMQGTDSP